MFKRKLTALEYHHPDSFNANNEEECRNLVVWLEDQKIRLYRIEDRGHLRDIKDPNWPKALMKYLDDLQCPLQSRQKNSVVDWLLAHAIRLEYAENADKFNNQSKQTKQSSEATGASLTESLVNLSAEDPDLKAGVTSLSRLLNLPEHHDHFVLLQAIRSLIEGKLSQSALKEAKGEKKKGTKGEKTDIIPLHTAELGFNTGDSAVNEAAKIIRLLHVSELRDLQTRINAAIVKVQSLTANPKTDQALGRVGR